MTTFLMDAVGSTHSFSLFRCLPLPSSSIHELNDCFTNGWQSTLALTFHDCLSHTHTQQKQWNWHGDIYIYSKNWRKLNLNEVFAIAKCWFAHCLIRWNEFCVLGFYSRRLNLLTNTFSRNVFGPIFHKQIPHRTTVLVVYITPKILLMELDFNENET